MVLDPSIEYCTQIAKRTGFVTIIVFIILSWLSLQRYLPWTISLAPLWIILILILISIYMLINSIVPAIQENTKNIILFNTFNVISTSFVFLAFLALKLEDEISLGWGFVFIPFWYGLAICFGFLCFLVPKMVKYDDFRRPGMFLCLWFVGISASSVLEVLHLEDIVNMSLWSILSPVIFIEILHFITYSVSFQYSRISYKHKTDSSTNSFCSIELLTVAFIFTLTSSLVAIESLSDWIDPANSLISLGVSLSSWMIIQERYYQKIKNFQYKYFEPYN